MTDVITYTVNVSIVETVDNFYEVTASYINDCGKEYTARMVGEIDPWDDIYIPVYKELAECALHKALLTKFNLIVKVKYPDIDDPYDGFIEGETKEYKYRYLPAN